MALWRMSACQPCPRLRRGAQAPTRGRRGGRHELQGLVDDPCRERFVDAVVAAHRTTRRTTRLNPSSDSRRRAEGGSCHISSEWLRVGWCSLIESADASDESELSRVLNTRGVQPGRFVYPWESDDPR